jgi:hypothetical protein
MKIMKIVTAMTAVTIMFATSAVIASESDYDFKECKAFPNCNTARFTVRNNQSSTKTAKFIFRGECFRNDNGRAANGTIFIKNPQRKMSGRVDKIRGKKLDIVGQGGFELFADVRPGYKIAAYVRLQCEANSNGEAFLYADLLDVSR